MEKKRRNYLKIACYLVVPIAMFFFLQCLLVPKYAEGVVEGNMIAEYYQEKKDFDVIFVGDCEVYENFSPAYLWENYGINSYIRGSAEQYIFQTYYVLEDTLRYETPKVAIFNAQALQYDEARSEAYNRMTIDGMKWSPSKIKCIQASMTPEEHWIEYVFPLLRFHSRWQELDGIDLQYLFDRKKVTHNGYYLRVDVKPAGQLPAVKPLGDYSFSERAWSYLDKIRELCEEKGVELLLIKAPSLYPHWYSEWDDQVKEYAAKYGLRYENMIDQAEYVGIDYATDTYDGGLHMNLSGAEKCAAFLGEILQKDYGLADRRSEAELSKIWEQKLKEFQEDVNRQKVYYGIE